ncbi:MAG: hypothetical protein P8R42_08065 [Candidatus Binatia bacterium]|nr:hypothetical protein [Candidatus Binatia bacterium]
MDVASKSRLLLIEGIVGSGKSSTAKELARRLHKNGRPARWVREEAADHPVTAKSEDRPEPIVTRIEWWLRHWTNIAARNDDMDLVLEGTAFQSTVRMLFAERVPRSRIDEYVDQFIVALRPADARMIYLRRLHPERDLRERVLPLRGEDWTARVARYCESTPIGRGRGWRGADGLVAFWCEYRALCDELVDRMDIPALSIDPTGRAWSAIHDEIEAWVLQSRDEISSLTA